MSTRADLNTLLDVPAVTDLATGGVHFQLVQDQTLSPPFCLFHFETGDETWAMGNSGLENEVWIVKGAGPDAGVCDAIDLAARSLLHNAIGVLCRRLGAIDYSAVEHGEVTYYKGSRYRIRKDMA